MRLGWGVGVYVENEEERERKRKERWRKGETWKERSKKKGRKKEKKGRKEIKKIKKKQRERKKGNKKGERAKGYLSGCLTRMVAKTGWDSVASRSIEKLGYPHPMGFKILVLGTCWGIPCGGISGESQHYICSMIMQTPLGWAMHLHSFSISTTHIWT